MDCIFNNRHGRQRLRRRKRYIGSTKTLDFTINEHFLWSSRQAYEACTGANERFLTSGKNADDYNKDPDVILACETGFGNIKPKVATLKLGEQVELVDTRDCAPMVGVRVLSGKAKGETGCMAGEALSSVKP